MDDPSSLEERFVRAEQALGHRFSDRTLLRVALTHPSYADELGLAETYERLEFLGDSVISLVAADKAYHLHPERGEGELTRLKIAAVRGSTLADAADRLGLGEAILLGTSELAAGGRGRGTALENVFEALCGAFYLDAGFHAVREFLDDVLGPVLRSPGVLLAAHPKTALQEYLQSSGRTPKYRIVAETGLPHERRFTAVVLVDGDVLGEGEGATKRDAEMGAAREALKRLGVDSSTPSSTA